MSAPSDQPAARGVGALDDLRLPVHSSFGLTQQTAIIIDHPLPTSARSALVNGGVIEHFKWQQGSATRLLLNLHDGSVRTHETEPLFVFIPCTPSRRRNHGARPARLRRRHDRAQLSLPDFARAF